MTQLWPSVLCQTDGPTFFTLEYLNHEVLCLYTKDCKMPNHHPSMTMLDSWYEVFVLICCV